MTLYGLCGIYQIINKVNGHKFVGSSVDIGHRFAVHRVELNRGEHHSPYLQRAWIKYGADNFELTVLLECDTSELIKHEQYFIDTLHPDYNMCKVAGSSLGVKHTPEVCEKMGNSRRGKPLSEAHKKAISQGNIGRTKTPEQIENHRNALLGFKHTDETKVKLSAVRKGKPVAPEHKARYKTMNLGKVRTPEMRERISRGKREANAKKRIESQLEVGQCQLC